MPPGANLPLVGRGRVLAELDAILEEARAGRGGLVLLTGEPGIGKTRMATEAVRRAADFRSVWSWCASDTATSSYRPWIHVMRELSAADPQIAELIPASPELRGLLSHQPAALGAMLDAKPSAGNCSTP
jgi:predicted ATPase